MTNRGLLHEKYIADRLRHRGFELVTATAGFGNGFPDLIAVKNSLAIHVEIKQSKRAQMGSCRRWGYSPKRNFYIDGQCTPNEQCVVRLLNESYVAKDNALKYFEEMNRILPAPVGDISSGCLRSIADSPEYRRFLIKLFAHKKTISNQIATLSSRRLNTAVMQYYVDKFQPIDRYENALLMVFGDEAFMIQSDKGTANRQLVCDALGVSELPYLPTDIDIRLECRIQPRAKRGNFDLMASYRYAGKVAIGIL